MRTKDAIGYYGNRTNLAKECDVSPQAITYWWKIGVVPPDKAMALEIATKGALKVVPSLYIKRRKAKAKQ